MPRKSTPGSCKCNAVFAYNIDANDPNNDPDSSKPLFDVEGVEPVFSDCGQATRGGNFAPGHDAKLKGVLIKLKRAGQPYNYISGGLMISGDPMTEALKYGWGRFLTHQPKRRVRKPRVNAEGQPERSEYPKDVTVKVGRWTYRGQQLSDGRVIYQNKAGDTLETTSNKVVTDVPAPKQGGKQQSKASFKGLQDLLP